MIALLLAASLAGAVEPAQQAVDAAFKRVAVLIAGQKGKDARAIAASDREAMALGSGVAAHGWRAVEPLAQVANDMKRPTKVRLFAASYLGLTLDAAAFGPLADILTDTNQDAVVRTAAAESLAALPVRPATLRGALTKALADENLPPDARDTILLAAARVGVSDAETARLAAHRLGARPAGRELEAAKNIARALGRAPGARTVDALLDLLEFYPSVDEPRGSVVDALAARHDDLLLWRRPIARSAIEGALSSETADPKRMVTLVKLAGDFGPELAPALSRLSAHPDAEVLVESAEALVKLNDQKAAKRALPVLEKVVAGALNDPRFSPLEGRPDPAVLLTRLEKAVAAVNVIATKP